VCTSIALQQFPVQVQRRQRLGTSDGALRQLLTDDSIFKIPRMSGNPLVGAENFA
jgi:hypothetical protein